VVWDLCKGSRALGWRYDAVADEDGLYLCSSLVFRVVGRADKAGGVHESVRLGGPGRSPGGRGA
jgi:hypothetical protein